MGHLNELHDKYFDKGLRIIAVSPEPVSRLESVMIDTHGAKYWMASDPGRGLLANFGGGGIPHAYLVDASGTIVGDSHPASLSDAQIEKLLEGAFDPRLERELHASLRSLVRSYEKGDYGKAWAGAARYAEDGEDRVRSSDAQYLREKCEAAAAFHRKLVEKAIETKDYDPALDLLKSLARDFAGMEMADWATDTRKKLDSDPAVKTERKAWSAYEKAQAKERKAGGRERKLRPAISAYRRIVKKYPGTRAAKMAEDALARLGG